MVVSFNNIETCIAGIYTGEYRVSRQISEFHYPSLSTYRPLVKKKALVVMEKKNKVRDVGFKILGATVLIGTVAAGVICSDKIIFYSKQLSGFGKEIWGKLSKKIPEFFLKNWNIFRNNSAKILESIAKTIRPNNLVVSTVVADADVGNK